MVSSPTSLRVLYSFPHKLGAGRICTTAWHQVDGVAAAGAEVTVFAGCINRPFATPVQVRTTLAWKKLRMPYRLLGTRRACALHDAVVARELEKMAGRFDLVHLWPLAAARTIAVAKKLGIPTVLERPNAHTRYAYEAVQRECRKLGIRMPDGHEHQFDQAVLNREVEEYEAADKLLCPSEFVARTFLDHGFPKEKLARHQYGFDHELYHPPEFPRSTQEGLRFLFAGGCAPRKGLHYALDAWLKSSASEQGSFVIAGGFIPGYAEVLSKQLRHPRVQVLGHCTEMPNIMRESDVLVLPSIEEGSALVTYEARGAGCVLLVSDAAGAVCKHGENALVHRVGDVETLAQQMTSLDKDRQQLARLRAASLCTVREITWAAAGRKLFNVYRDILTSK